MESRNNVKKEAINVVCRIRPLNQMERMKNSTMSVSFPGPNSVAIGGVTERFVSCANDVLEALDEGKINRHVSVTSSVINALVEGNTHVPYRDSKLTRILQQSLGGNSKTTIIIAASPASFNENETKSTFTFGVRAKTIKNQVTLNAQLTAEEWRRLYESESDRTKGLCGALSSLDSEIKRWRSGEKVPKDDWFTEDKYAKLLKDSLVQQSISPSVNQSLCYSANEQYDPSSPAQTSLELLKHKLTGSCPVTETNNDADIRELFRLLDEKDDEINKQGQIITKLESQLSGLQSDYTRIKQENEKLQNLYEQAQRTTEESRSEVKDVLHALEELAITYDAKNNETKRCNKEIEMLNGELDRLKLQAESHESEIMMTKEASRKVREKLQDLLQVISSELGEVGSYISKNLRYTKPKVFQSLEEQAAALKLYVLQMKCEAELSFKDINSSKSHKKEHTQEELTEIQHDTDRKIRELHDIIAEYDKNIRKREEDNAKLEGDLQEASKELFKLRMNDNLISEIKLAENNHEQIYSRVQSMIERSGQHYQQQLTRAWGDCEKAVHECEQIKEENIIFKHQIERLMKEVEYLRGKKADQEVITKDPLTVEKDQAYNEIKSMEDTVLHELQILNSLRKVFVADLKTRISKFNSKSGSNPEDELLEETQSCGSAVQREKINFLKTSLDNLTKVHKQLVRDNADLRCDLPKLEKRLKASCERIKDLETALREGKEQMIREKRKYQQEIERIKEAAWTNGGARLKTNIAKPIRAGQLKE
ncbi:unnamed protein product [Trichobilharzia szidati]|nr:unnamed protein product [Trichobilharzia szidati]